MKYYLAAITAYTVWGFFQSCAETPACLFFRRYFILPGIQLCVADAVDKLSFQAGKMQGNLPVI